MLNVDDYFSPSILDRPLDALWHNLAEHYLCQEHPLILQMQNYACISSWEMSKTTQLAANIIARVRADKSQKSLAQAFLEEYNLSSQEGILLLCLAESLMRVSDADTLDSILRDRLSQINWAKHVKHSDSFLVNASTWALLLTGRLTPQPEQKMTVKQGVKHLISQLTEPIVRKALHKAINMIAEQYIIGSTIEQALATSVTQAQPKELSTELAFSFDYLAEAALINEQVQQAKHQYIQAIHHIAHHNRQHQRHDNISIRLSVLQPQFDYRYRQHAISELMATLLPLLELAQALDVGVYLDGETATRLELCLTVFERLISHSSLRGWGKLGIAIQAYSKRSLASLCWLAALAKKQQTSIPIRLVKGAYWREDMRQAQLNHLSDFPVFTSQAATDISFLCNARWLLSHYVTPYLKAEFATHNPHTVAALEVMAAQHPIKMQKVYGMGEPLYTIHPQPSLCVLAAFGPHHQLVPFILRRLLDFAAQPGFVPQLQSKQQPLSELIEHPIDKYATLSPAERPAPSAKETLFSINLPCQHTLNHWLQACAPFLSQVEECRSIIHHSGTLNPAHETQANAASMGQLACPHAIDTRYAHLHFASKADCELAVSAAQQGFDSGQKPPLEQRKHMLIEFSSTLVNHAPLLLARYMASTGQPIFAAETELRLAIKLFKQTLEQGIHLFDEQEVSLADPTPYHWQRQGRGVWLCCPEPTHPLITLLTQLAGALICANSVIVACCPTSASICSQLVRLLQQQGLAENGLQLIISDPSWTLPLPGSCMAKLNGISGSFTQEQRQQLNQINQDVNNKQQQAIKHNVMNMMIIDNSTAFEDLISVILTLAFDLAGQSPTSLKLICVEQDIADEFIYLLSNAMIELDIANHDLSQGCVGPLLNAARLDMFNQHAKQLSQQASLLRQTPMAHDLNGYYAPPYLFQVDDLQQINAEIKGPVLHLYRYSNSTLQPLLDELNRIQAKGYCSIHSRHQTRLRQLEHGILGRQLIINQNHSLPLAAYYATFDDQQAGITYSQLEATLCQNAGKPLTNH
ncbi:proline dehydrogenase family protein [Motilimonas eburnea]|uniref:proline dehydrogenase family protein n=1 Tax=Motilimonas eburnea TaxID=1737488 RepID=UPI001E2D0422|nr:proline dehydrogenase family protein [Motilimonas eburnea]MCE2570899.1 proline dehydrogenase family protein [Motilimonas eburnea]